MQMSKMQCKKVTKCCSNLPQLYAENLLLNLSYLSNSVADRHSKSEIADVKNFY